jgi:hypothetical protein
MTSRFSPIVAHGLVCLLLSGCNTPNFGGIRGPNPTMQSGEVISASDNTRLIITALANDNNISLGQGAIPSSTFYNVAVAGFNFIDDQCANYFDRLFYVQRDKQLADNVLLAGSQATSAILTITKASTITLGVVAAAFGFSSTAVDSVAGTFLYQLPPSTTYGFVKDIQSAYREGVDPKKITTPAEAYHVMQDYLAICLPPNIEARVLERVAGTKATPTAPTGGNAAPGVELGDKTAPPAKIVKVIATQPIPVPPTPTTRIPGALDDYEAFFNPVALAKIQNSLCVEPTSNWDTETRTGIVNFFQSFDASKGTNHQHVKDGINKVDAGILVKAITEFKQNPGAPNCSQLSDQQRVDWQRTLGGLVATQSPAH